jgi:hypothetical protein
MALFDIFRRGGIRTLGELAAFIGEQAALLADKAVEDYAALRAGADAPAAMADAGLRAALDKARAEASPLALAMVGEMVEGTLRPVAEANEQAVREGLTALALECFDRRPAPNAAADDVRRAARSDVERALADTANRSAKPVAAIADAYASLFLALMPIHEKLGGDDFAALSGMLRTMLTAVRDKLAECAELANLAAQLAAKAGAPPAQTE